MSYDPQPTDEEEAPPMYSEVDDNRNISDKHYQEEQQQEEDEEEEEETNRPRTPEPQQPKVEEVQVDACWRVMVQQWRLTQRASHSHGFPARE